MSPSDGTVSNGPEDAAGNPLAPQAAPDDSPLLTARGLRKSFGDNEVLRSIDLDVRRGEVVVLIGPSGSGKTTVLRSLNGLETPDGGTICSPADPSSISRRRCRRARGSHCATGRQWCSSSTTCSRT